MNNNNSRTNPANANDKNRGPRINRMIRISPIRVIGPDNEQIGILETLEALRIAEEHGLDLVEVAPNSRPPVCRIMDYGKYKYDQAKRQKKNKARSAEMKQIRLGRSVKIDEHDVKIRINQAYRFLIAGHKVQITQRFRGREIVHKDMGLERLTRVAEALASIAKVEVSPRWAGRQASIILAPDPNATRALEKAGQKPVPPPEIDQKILDELDAMGDDGDFDDDDDDFDGEDDDLDGEEGGEEGGA